MSMRGALDVFRPGARIVQARVSPDEERTYAVAGIPPREVPGSLPDGRAFLLPGMVEVQLAVLGRDETLARVDAALDLARTTA